ncbi:MAG: response regulator [Actinomycetota bacterium]|nr:response regulator [Actinomycetota bacterium]
MTGPRSREVVLLEDSADDAEMFAEAANRVATDVRVVRFATASAMYESFDPGAAPPLLVVTDARLPDASAVDVIERVIGRSGMPWTPVVVMSGLADPSLIAECYTAGASGFLVKPAGFGELCDAVGTLISYWSATVTLPDDRP